MFWQFNSYLDAERCESQAAVWWRDETVVDSFIGNRPSGDKVVSNSQNVCVVALTHPDLKYMQYMLVSIFHWPALNVFADWWDEWKIAFEDARGGRLALSTV